MRAPVTLCIRSIMPTNTEYHYYRIDMVDKVGDIQRSKSDLVRPRRSTDHFSLSIFIVVTLTDRPTQHRSLGVQCCAWRCMVGLHVRLVRSPTTEVVEESRMRAQLARVARAVACFVALQAPTSYEYKQLFCR